MLFYFNLALLMGGLGYAVLSKGGAVTPDWNLALVAIGIAVLLRSRCRVSRMSAWVWIPVVVLLAIPLLQLVPLSRGAIALLSPERAGQLAALDAVEVLGWAPLSVAPPATVDYFFRLVAYVGVVLSVRGMAPERPWLVAAPLVAIGGLEVLLGLVQVAANWPNGSARGTYVDRDHYAGLLEMVFPLVVMYAGAIWWRMDRRERTPAVPAMGAAALVILAGLFLLAMVYSLSRTGFVVILSTLVAMAVLSFVPLVGSRRWRVGLVAGLAGLAGLAFVFLPTDQLIARFAETASTEAISADTRLKFWVETVSLVKAYPLVGCGLGAYEPAFRRFQATLPLNTIDYAHNDYLQFLAELGVAGFAVLAVLVVVVLGRTVRAALRLEDVNERCLAIACVAAMFGILLHSAVDFNLQMPANATAMAWIVGMGLGLKAPRLRRE